MLSPPLPAPHGVGVQAPFCLDDGGLDALALVFRGSDGAALHELCPAAPADAGSASAFALGLVTQLAQGQPIIWARQRLCDIETGAFTAAGVAALGCDPAQIRLVRVRDPLAGLQATLEAARLPGLGAAVLELWGEAAAYDLTASRRLVLASARSRTPVLVLRTGGILRPSAALSRWQLAALPSLPLAAGAPGLPAMSLTLLRSRAGRDGVQLHVEWNPHAQRFRVTSASGGQFLHTGSDPSGRTGTAPVSGHGPAFSADRAPAPVERDRRTG